MPGGARQEATHSHRNQLRAFLVPAPEPWAAAACLLTAGEDGGDALRRGARNLAWATILPW